VFATCIHIWCHEKSCYLSILKLKFPPVRKTYCGPEEDWFCPLKMEAACTFKMYLPAKLHGVTTQKTTVLRVIAMKASKHMYLFISVTIFLPHVWSIFELLSVLYY
jgi:hypothetical protein